MPEVLILFRHSPNSLFWLEKQAQNTAAERVIVIHNAGTKSAARSLSGDEVQIALDDG